MQVRILQIRGYDTRQKGERAGAYHANGDDADLRRDEGRHGPRRPVPQATARCWKPTIASSAYKKCKTFDIEAELQKNRRHAGADPRKNKAVDHVHYPGGGILV